MAKAKVQRSIRPVRNGWIPELWASPKPFGLGEQHPNNFWEVFRAVWENQDNLGYAYNILDQGVCDGCALGTSGMKDWTVTGLHLCNIRHQMAMCWRTSKLSDLNVRVICVDWAEFHIR
jgi:hypothetical protein